MKKKKNNNNNVKLILALALALIVLIGGTYAWYNITKTASSTNKIVAGSVELELDETASNGIRLQKAKPLTYAQGLNEQQYKFTVTNKSSAATSYTISLVDDYSNDTGITSEDKIPDSKIRYLLIEEGGTESAANTKILENNRDLVSDVLAAKNSTGDSKDYVLRIWIDSRAGTEVMNKIFNAKISIVASQNHS